jgi:hypothetical protein
MPGSVNFADWSLSWSIPSAWGGGLVISKANFRGTSVLYKGTQPFVLVPYHGDSPHFKDGLNDQGAPFTPVLPTSANAPAGLATPPAGNDNQYDPVGNPTGAVVVEKLPGTLLEPAKAVVWAKLQCVNYQYVQRWEFNADGSLEAGVGLGGRLWTTNEPRAGHVHNFYFRLDFDIVASGNNLVQEFSHANNQPGSDGWANVVVEGKRTANPGQAAKWRVLNKAAKPNGKLRSYEITPASDMAPDGVYSTADLWVLRYDGSQDGAAVGYTDAVLGTTYLHGANASVDGQDVVVWYCLRHHHEPRQLGEETWVLPYEFVSFRIESRDFMDATPKNLYATTPPSPQ